MEQTPERPPVSWKTKLCVLIAIVIFLIIVFTVVRHRYVEKEALRMAKRKIKILSDPKLQKRLKMMIGSDEWKMVLALPKAERENAIKNITDRLVGFKEAKENRTSL